MAGDRGHDGHCLIGEIVNTPDQKLVFKANLRLQRHSVAAQITARSAAVNALP
jgi:hypothetical protein